MREKNLISVIKNTLNSNYIGDDCAYLKELGIVITQDSLVENVHFTLDTITPFQLGYKSVMVNGSDVAASGAEPKYLTIALSLPEYILSEKGNDDFVSQFYSGAKQACDECGVEIVGGDITGSDKVMISVCAIGKTQGRNISSRKYAKSGYKIVVAGMHGTSAAGLKILQSIPILPLAHLWERESDVDELASHTSAGEGFVILNLIQNLKIQDSEKNSLIKAHLEPKAHVNFGKNAGQNIKENYAMMDTSDGLMDALSTVANESKVLLEIDFDKIPHDKILEKFDNWQDLVLFGGEDYGIVAVIPEKYDIGGTVIGYAKEGLGVNLKINGKTLFYSKKDVENKVFNHWDR